MSNTNPPPPATKSLADLVMPPVVYGLPGMDRVQVYSNLDYSGVDPTRLLMDVYVPTDSTSNEPRPVMILVHGGAGQRPGMLTPTGLASVCGRSEAP